MKLEFNVVQLSESYQQEKNEVDRLNAQAIETEWDFDKRILAQRKEAEGLYIINRKQNVVLQQTKQFRANVNILKGITAFTGLFAITLLFARTHQ